MTLRIDFELESTGETVSAQGDAGEKLTQIAYRAGVVIQQTCGGKASCTDCRVVVSADCLDAVDKMQSAETSALGNVFHITRERLACQTHVVNNLKLWVPDPKRYAKGKRYERR